MIFGIDLGTSNSLIAYLVDGKPVAIPNALGQLLTPSVVSLDGDTLLVGQSAKERLITHPNLTTAAFKRLMGRKTMTKLGKREFSPEELSAMVLKSLKADAQSHTGAEVRDVVISVPAYFNDQQRKATKAAGEIAGLNVLRLVNEPTAAALMHGIHERDAESKFLVFDLGGGTFDVTILERFSGIMEVRATGGDSFLGGEDFTQVMCDLIVKRANIKVDEGKDPKKFGSLKFVAESAKRTLASQDEAQLTLPANLCPDSDTQALTVTLFEYEKACAQLLEKMREPIERALRDARMRAAELDEVVMVGGATRMRMVRSLIARLFGRIPARHVDPDQTVALGAAVCAGLIARDAAFEEMVLTDVCPHSLGTDVSEQTSNGGYVGDIFLPIIERNTILPASRVRGLTTLRDGDEVMHISIYQGESRKCSQNLKLGELTIPIPKRKAGEVHVNVRYTYDVNGILDIDVDVQGTDTARSLVIKELAGDLSDDEIAKRRAVLTGLKIHPRDQEMNRALIERANRMYEHSLGSTRQTIGQWLNQFEVVLSRQDPVQIRQEVKSFENALNSLEKGDVW